QRLQKIDISNTVAFLGYFNYTFINAFINGRKYFSNKNNAQRKAPNLGRWVQGYGVSYCCYYLFRVDSS
ncbi:hypothetical protein, partial [uncultured Psychrobacter sp.]|uniref:hypothetical protein n=1 Tax=uncultured Psychrobacter sp. TaxID=259303 RepID=UPI002595E35D